ncbi:hypothetical protein M1N87_02130, partial [Dehalococcoidia bacterium]|nr:hypothetical protein [Dehalococcoidia bacterium]
QHLSRIASMFPPFLLGSGSLAAYNLFRVLPETGATIRGAYRLPLSVSFSGLYRQKDNDLCTQSEDNKSRCAVQLRPFS